MRLERLWRVVGSGRVALNLLRLGHKWFEQGVTEEVDRLLVHEYSGDHDALCKLGAGLKWLTWRGRRG